jgi:TRAP transporter TAXI family solute receptor
MASALACACASKPPAAPADDLRFATGRPNGVWGIVGDALANQYRQHLRDARIEVPPILDLEAKVDALEQGDLEIALLDSETAYRAYRNGTNSVPTPHQNIRAIAVLFPTVVQIVTRSDAGIRTISDLRGKRVDVGEEGGYPDEATRLILESFGLDYSTVHPIFGATADPGQSLRDRQVDALVFWTPLYHPSIVHVMDTIPATVLPLDHKRIGFIQDHNHFLKSTVIPAGAYPNQADDVLTVGQDVLLLCRRDLAEPLVLNLTKILFDSVPSLRNAHKAAFAITPERGPTASIPLHPGAARYYRERELP